MTSPIQAGNQKLETETAEQMELPKQKQSLGLVIRAAAQLPVEFWPDERISAIRAYVAKEATNIAELAAFLATCQRYGLDPMVGQLFLIKSDGGPKVCTGRDTWLSLARRETGYLGTEYGAVHAKDTFTSKREPDGTITVLHHIHGIGAARGPLAGAYALVHDSKLGHNIEVRDLSDFRHLMSKKNWTNYPSDMVVNRCLAAVWRKQYGFPGLLIVGEDDEVMMDPTARAMPPVDVQTQRPRGASAKLDEITKVAAAERESRTELAQDVVIEPAPPVEIREEGGVMGNTDTPAVMAEAEQRGKAEKKTEDLRRWHELMTKGPKRTEFEDMRLADINADYPEFQTEFGAEYAK